MGAEDYGEDYFERGIATQTSLYENYRWIAELTVPLAMTYIDLLGLKRTDTILDFGCAKGFSVKALRMLHRNAWGCDISEYAIGSSDAGVDDLLNLCNGHVVPFGQKFDWIIAKDVLEHIEEKDLPIVLGELRKHGKKMFAIIPLGRNGKFIVPAYELDKTHKLAKSATWWTDSFTESGWKRVELRHRVEGIKDSWKNFPRGNGFFTLS